MFSWAKSFFGRPGNSISPAAELQNHIDDGAETDLINIVGKDNAEILFGDRHPTLADMQNFFRDVADPKYLAALAEKLIIKFIEVNAAEKSFNKLIAAVAGAWMFHGLTNCVRMIPSEYKYKLKLAGGCVAAEYNLTDDVLRPNNGELIGESKTIWEYVSGDDELTGGYYEDPRLFWCLKRSLAYGVEARVFRRLVAAADVHLFNIIIEKIFDDDWSDTANKKIVIESNITRPRFDPAGSRKYISPKWWKHTVPAADKFETMSRLYVAENARAAGEDVRLSEVAVPIWDGSMLAPAPIRLWHNPKCSYCAEA
ncbi:MAG: hypothetical protein WDA28_13090 [Castellaniella sp.]